MKAYFINAKDELITEVDTKGAEHTKEMIGCKYFEIYPYNVNGNDMWTDEEANLGEYNYFFTLDNVIVSGNAILLGFDVDTGDCKDVNNLSLDNLKSRVTFMGKRYIDHDKLFSKFQVTEWK